MSEKEKIQFESFIARAVAEVVTAIRNDRTIKRATVYITPTLTVKATAQHARTRTARERGVTALVTVGKPNFAQREFIKTCIKVGEKFPVRKPQLEFVK